MKSAIISFSENGRELAEKISDNLKHTDSYVYNKYAINSDIAFDSGAELTKEIFRKYDNLIFISSVGLAVRLIAPVTESKETDPAVVVVDETGAFSISVLSGHIGGANELCAEVAEYIGAVPVITTATDRHETVAIDSFAKKNGLIYDELDTAKLLAAELIKGHSIGLYSEYRIDGKIPDEIKVLNSECIYHREDVEVVSDEEIPEYGVSITPNGDAEPFKYTWRLMAKDVTIGVGLKKDTDPEVFIEFIRHQLDVNDIDPRCIDSIASIDLKKNEMAAIKLSDELKVPFVTYTADELNSIDGSFTYSEFVKNTTGVDCVSERSAVYPDGKLFVTKQKDNGMTFAAGRKEIIISFED